MKFLLPKTYGFLLYSGLFSGAMGSGPVKGFNTPAVKNILSRTVDKTKLVPKEDGEKATFAAGCFWGVELTFQRVPGVLHTMVGYTAGCKEHPTYKDVCSGTSGHTEAVQMIFDPNVVSYKDLLVVLFDRMDPTSLNRQGGDQGTQYRSGVYYHSDDQKSSAEDFIKEVQPNYTNKIVVEVKQASKFWPAELYHQHYLQKGGQAADKGSLEPIKCYG